MYPLLKKFTALFTGFSLLFVVSIRPAQAVTLNAVQVAAGTFVVPGGTTIPAVVSSGLSRIPGWPGLLMVGALYAMDWYKDNQNTLNTLGANQKPIINGQPFVPPSVAASVTQWHVVLQGYAGTGNDPSYASAFNKACADQALKIKAIYPNCTISTSPDSVGGAGTGMCYKDSPDCTYLNGVNYVNTFTNSPSCPSGYTLSGSTCNLTNESAVPYPNDGKRQYKASGSGFQPDPRDLDPATTLTPDDLNFQTVDSYGNPVAQTVLPTPSGGVKLDQYLEKTLADGSKSTLHSSAEFSDAGTLLNTSVSEIPGSITNNITNITNGGSFPNATAPTGNIAFPTDYARQNTQEQVLDELKGTGYGTVPDYAQSLTDSKISSVGQQQQTDTILNGIHSAYSTDKGMWPSWFWSPPSVGCTNPSINIHGQPWTPDLCTPASNIRDAIGWLLALFAAYDIFGLMFRRPD